MGGIINRDHIPSILISINNWVCWKYATIDGKETKLPVDPHSGGLASTNDRNGWSSFNHAFDARNTWGCDGVGFELEESLGIVCIDIDHMSGNPEKEKIPAMFPGTYVERSPSGDGVHIWVLGKIPGKKRKGALVEMYESDRYITVTGEAISEIKEIHNCQEALNKLYEIAFPKKEVSEPTSIRKERYPENPPMPLDDRKILDRIARSKDAGKYEALARGDWKSQGFPSGSEGDLSICNILAWASNKDAKAIDRIFRTTGMYDEKWEREDYRTKTIQMAIDGVMPIVVKSTTPSVATVEEGEKRDGDSEAPAIERVIEPTEMEDAVNFVEQFKDKIFFNSYGGKQAWHQWNGSFWEKAAKPGDILRAWINQERASKTKFNTSQEFIKFEKRIRMISTDRYQKSMLSIISGLQEFHIQHSKLDQDQWLLNCNNGTLNLKTFELQPHNPADYITKSTFTNYDPASTSTRFDLFLQEIFEGKDEIIQYVLRSLGYSLTGSTSEQCFFFLYGTGSNGKSVFVETVGEILGSYASHTELDSFFVKYSDGPRQDLAVLAGSRFIRANETSQYKRVNGALLKQFTGGDPITTRYLHGLEFTYRPVAKLWICGNHLPDLSASDHGMWRRPRVIRFNKTFLKSDGDPYIKEKLLSEKSGILTTMVNALKKYNNLKRLDEPTEILNNNESYRAEIDPLADWIRQRCDVNPLHQSTFKSLYESYCNFLKDEGSTDMPSIQVFGRWLSAAGFQRVKNTSIKDRMGIKPLSSQSNNTPF